MNIEVSTGTSSNRIKKYWKKCVGSCHAATALREDWRRQLKTCREEFGFEYVRFHGILNDDMSVCLRNEDGSLEYSFFNIDSIFDFLLGIGMKPFIELSFMPAALASGSKTTMHYKANITPPKSYDEWADLNGALACHLIQRYGAEEVRTWFFEIWNEPNLDLFWTGTMEEYFQLYKSAVLAIKKADSKLMVGGPATAIDAWIPELKAFCAENGLPLDFISTHHYPTDAAYGKGLNMEEQMSRSKRGVLTVRLQKALEEAYPLPVYYTEWNNSPSPRDSYHDDPYNAAFIVKTITDSLKQLDCNLLECYSFWSFSDIFEECGFSSEPFHGGFGLMNIYGIPKPSYRAFQMLSRLSGECLEAVVDENSTIDCFACQDENNTVILISNYQVPLSPIKEERVSLRITGIKGVKSVILERIDESHANPKKVWMEIGSPTYPDNRQIQALMKASEMIQEKAEWTVDEEGLLININIKPFSVVAVYIESSCDCVKQH